MSAVWVYWTMAGVSKAQLGVAVFLVVLSEKSL